MLGLLPLSHILTQRKRIAFLQWGYCHHRQQRCHVPGGKPSFGLTAWLLEGCWRIWGWPPCKGHEFGEVFL